MIIILSFDWSVLDADWSVLDADWSVLDAVNHMSDKIWFTPPSEYPDQCLIKTKTK